MIDRTRLGTLLGEERERFAAAKTACPGAWWSCARGPSTGSRRSPRTGAESATVADTELEDYLHLALLNRDVLITPFHSMALMCPATTEAEVDRHTEAFADAVSALVA